MKHADNNNKTHKRKLHPITIIRAVIQLAAFLLMPGLFITVFGAIRGIFTSLIGGTFLWEEQVFNIFLLVVVSLVTFIWGRFFCGFLCSFGAMQDLLWLIGKHIPFRPIISQKADRIMKYLKYAVLAFIMIGVWSFGIFGDAVWSPWTVFGAAATPWFGLPPQTIILSVGAVLLLVIMTGSLLIERFFCKYLCPLGAIFALLSGFRIFGIRRDSGTCSGVCRICTRKCSMSVSLYKMDKVRSGECINCMKCTTVCPQDNIIADTVPAVTGTVAAMMIAGVSFVGSIPINTSVQTTTVVSDQNLSAGRFTDGVYTGSAQGFRSETVVSVNVENGIITSVTVESSGDDREFLAKAKQMIIPAIISAQSVDVDTVSGATFSSKGIINAVRDALGSQLVAETELPKKAQPESSVPETQPATEPSTEESAEDMPQEDTQEASTSNGGFADGIYTGHGSGFRGTTTVEVTVQNGSITDITVTSYQDDDRFFNRAKSSVISEILSEQSIDVDTVSGATFSSNSIKEAVANALELDFSNPNTSMGGRHRH